MNCRTSGPDLDALDLLAVDALALSPLHLPTEVASKLSSIFLRPMMVSPKVSYNVKKFFIMSKVSSPAIEEGHDQKDPGRTGIINETGMNALSPPILRTKLSKICIFGFKDLQNRSWIGVTSCLDTDMLANKRSRDFRVLFGIFSLSQRLPSPRQSAH